MLRYIIVALLACFSLFVNSARAQEVANTFRYPVTSDGLGSSYVYSQGYRDPNSRHDGADFAYNCGEPIYAVANGQVEQSGYFVSRDGNGNVIPNTGWGNLIRIKHTLPNGDERYSQYAHLQERYVSNGETVTYGQQIGIMGTTGYSTGCHLHFMIITVGDARGCGYFPSASGCLGDWTEERYWSTFIDPTDFIESHQLDCSTYTSEFSSTKSAFGSFIGSKTGSPYLYGGLCAQNYDASGTSNGTSAILFDPSGEANQAYSGMLWLLRDLKLSTSHKYLSMLDSVYNLIIPKASNLEYLQT